MVAAAVTQHYTDFVAKDGLFHLNESGRSQTVQASAEMPVEISDRRDHSVRE